MSWPWRSGNSIELLENGEEFFPAVFEAIEQAEEEVLLETFILYDDQIGRELLGLIVEAARRGVHCVLLLDGYGSHALSSEVVEGVTAAGAEVRFHDPRRSFFGWRTHIFRRMHRKLVVIDQKVAFCGGINFSVVHLHQLGPVAKQDFAVRLEGPVVRDVRDYVRSLAGGEGPPAPTHSPGKTAGIADVRFAVRDNRFQRTAIEDRYLEGIHAARERIVIANGYFFPSYRLFKALRSAARRGVEVVLIVQSREHLPVSMKAAPTVYDDFLAAGVEIYEYENRRLHGKVAVIDRLWATVGSSNLDPLSLWLNLEANVFVHDAGFNAELARRLKRLVAEDCRRLESPDPTKVGLASFLRGRLVFHLLRYLPGFFGLMPAHTPQIREVEAPARDGAEAQALYAGGAVEMPRERVPR